MQQLKVFFGGKVSPNSRFAPAQWREDLTWEVNQRLKTRRIRDITSVPQRAAFIYERRLPVGILFSQSCYYIRHADVFVVNLTDDISVGGSQEMLIARQFGVPVIGLAPRGGKFNRLKYELGGKTYWNWIHPFVGSLCDLVVQSAEELAAALDDLEHLPSSEITSVSSAISYYEQRASAVDTTVNRILSFDGQSTSFKPKLRVYFAGKMKAADFPEATWRDHFAALIERKSRFTAANLDFLEVSHSAIDENDPKLIFGRDAYLIRSSDLVVVNLSDDISVGGSVEMMLAKLFHRPLIGIARYGGKFVSDDHVVFGRKVPQYVNPFVAATCDWLVHEPDDLPAVVDELYTKPVKNASILLNALAWYEERALPYDRVAQGLAVA